MANLKSSVLPVQGGFLVVRPDLSVFDDLVEVGRDERERVYNMNRELICVSERTSALGTIFF